MNTYRRSAVYLALASLSLPAAGVDFNLGNDVGIKLNGTVTAGTMIRTEAPDPEVLGALSPLRVGLPAGQLGANAGGSDLNFQKNRPVSTVVKGVFDLEVKRGDFGLFARAKAWDDFTLKDGNRDYGNSVNGFQQGAPLSDNGFDPEAKFSNAVIADAYVFGKANFGGDNTLDVRAGRQTLNWGVAQFTGGGVNVINPVDAPALQRPGSLPQESKVPVGMVYANFAAGKQWAKSNHL